MRALACLAALVALALIDRDRSEHRRATRRRAEVTRFGGVAVAWRLRPRGTPLVLGRFATPRWRPTPVLIAARAPGSVLVVGPTQSGKTTLLCAPVLCAWGGPVLAASVKGDLVARTAARRGELGGVQVVSTELEGASVFDPVTLARTPAAARGLARDLTIGTGAGQTAGDQEFWSSLSAKLLAPLLLAANRAGGSIATVRSWVDRRDLEAPLELLDEEDADTLVASFTRDDRTLGSVLATVEAAIESLRAGADTVDPARLLDGANTCYLSAPLHDQRRFRPMFAGLLRQVLAEAATRAERGSPSGLLVLLDEAASIAPLEELDQVAATCQGQGVTLVTVWQDLAQLVARYGPKARTVVNNHTSRVLLGGLADPTLAEWLPTLTGPARVASGRPVVAVAPEQLRQWPRGAAVLVTGREPPLRLRLGSAHPARERRS
jgi:type IV secretory pathway TraG/TraD family ATPase VirD4